MKTNREFAQWLLGYVQTGGEPGERLTTAHCARCAEAGKNTTAGFVWRHETFGLLFETVTRQSRRWQFAKLTDTSPSLHTGLPDWKRSRMVIPLDDVQTITTSCKKGHIVTVESGDLARNAKARRHATGTRVYQPKD